jgi:uncharacterized phage protein (TIGR02220 family)
MSGWVKLHRQILEWEWYDDHNTFRLFIHLLLKANHKEKKYRGMLLQTGTILTSRDILALEVGLSVRQTRTALIKLKSTNEVAIKTSGQGTIIQIVNYAKYQVETSETTNERPTSDQQTTTNKKEKNNKKDNLIDYPLLLNHINNTLGRQFKVINEKVKGSFKARLKEGYSQEDILKAITNCKASTFHKENNYEYCTPEYFSRSATLDKYSNRTIVTESDAIVAHLRAYANASKTR